MGTEKLVVGVDEKWETYTGYTKMDISCATANNDLYCLQGTWEYDVRKWNKYEDTFDTLLETSYGRGAFGNFASAVPADAGALYQCLPSDYGYGYGYGLKKKQESNSQNFIVPIRPDVANVTKPETKQAQ